MYLRLINKEVTTFVPTPQIIHVPQIIEWHIPVPNDDYDVSDTRSYQFARKVEYAWKANFNQCENRLMYALTGVCWDLLV